METPTLNYLNNGHGLASWLLTRDHKRIGLLYLVSITAFFFLGGYFDRAIDKGDINVNVAAPNIELPDVQITPPASEPSNKSGN